MRVFTGNEPIDELKDVLKSLRGPHTIIVDDFEVIGADSPLGGALAEAYAAMRDTANAMVVAGSIDEVTSVYRGLTVELKRGRTGLLLAPRAANDGDVLNLRLPRSVGSAVPVGRGVFATPTGWRWVQVPRM